MPDVESLEWVAEEQQERLAELSQLRGGWHEWLPAELDGRWPDWRASTEDTLSPWLDQVLDELLGVTAPVGTAEVEPATGEDVTSLRWVTKEQQAYLQQMAAVRGDWQNWLPLELDAVWPDWRQSDAETLEVWLDSLLPMWVSPTPLEASAAGAESQAPAGEGEAARTELAGEEPAEADDIANSVADALNALDTQTAHDLQDLLTQDGSDIDPAELDEIIKAAAAEALRRAGSTAS